MCIGYSVLSTAQKQCRSAGPCKKRVGNAKTNRITGISKTVVAAAVN
jgi:hypothetical protein